MFNIEHIMTKTVYTIDPDQSTFEAALFMAEKNISGLIIVEQSKPIGVITRSDLFEKVLAKGLVLKDFAIRQIMTSPVCTLHIEKSAMLLPELMAQKRIKQIPIVNDEGNLAGIVTQTDVFRHLTLRSNIDGL